MPKTFSRPRLAPSACFLRNRFQLFATPPKPRRVGHRIALLCCLSLCGVACSGCNFVESVILGPSIDTKSVPNAVVGAPYSFKIQASGADLSSWDISATPPGLDFDGGRIKGTPTKGGSFKFEVSVFDYTHDYLKSDSRDFTMLILDITTTGVPNGVANSSYTPTTFSAIGAVGTPAWTLSGGSLPAGMSFSSAGILDGTPTTAGTYPFSVTVKDQDVPPRSRAREFSLLVQNPTPLLSSLSPTSVVEGGSDFILTLTGSDFVPTSIVRWNGEDRPTFTLNSAQLTAAIPASDIATAGSASVTVSNSAPRGGVSVPLMLPVVVATAFARASLDSAGAEANRPSLLPAISAGGRFIAFESEADNLVGGDQNRTADIFLRDTCATATPNCHPSTVRISSAIDGGDANGPSAHAAISADGRFVAFDSLASNLVANDFNQRADVFLRDTCLGAPKGCQPLTEKISSPSATEDADGASHHPSVSANGRLVAFVSAATNLTSGEPNPAEGVFLRDTCRGAEGDCQPVTSVISAVSEGILPAIFHSEPSLSEDGRYVVFVSEFGLASNKRVKIILLRDTCFGAGPECRSSIEIVSMNQEAGAVADGDSFQPRVTADGRYVVYSSKATNLAPGVGLKGGHAHVFLRDTCRHFSAACVPSTRIVSAGMQNLGLEGGSLNPTIGRDGRYIVFGSTGSAGVSEVFLADLCTGAPKCVSSVSRISTNSAEQADGESFSPVLSADDQYVAFASNAGNLVRNDSNFAADVFVTRRAQPLP